MKEVKNEKKSKGTAKGTKGSRKPNNRGNDKRVDIPMDTKLSDAINSPDYYFDLQSPLAGQLMNFSFNQFQGVDFEVGRTNAGKPYKAEVANILRIGINPSPGYVDQKYPLTSGINQQGLRNFIELSSNNAKTTQYAPQDVTMLLLALGEVASMISWGTRAFGIATLVNQRNRAYPKQALDMSGFDATDFFANMARYRKEFNTLITVANKIPFFDGVPYIKKCAEMYSGLYLDSESSMAQTFMFTPFSTWVLDEQYDENGSGLRTERFETTGTYATITFGSFLEILEEQLNVLLSSATLNYVYSDVLRIMSNKGGSRLLFAQVPDGYTVIPQHIPESSLWLHNMTPTGYPLATENQKPITGYSFTNDNDVVCEVDSNTIIYRPQFKQFSGVHRSAIVDFEHDNPTIEEKISATRMSVIATTEFIDGYFYTKDVALPDHYPVNIAILSGSATRTGTADLALDIANISPAYFNILSHLTKFHYGPLFYVTDEDNAEDALVSVLGDLNYYTVLDWSVLHPIHSAAFLKLFSI